MKYTLEGMPGIENIYAEIEACKKYNVDHRANRGQTESTIEKLHPCRIEYRVIDVREETKTAKTFRLASPDGYLPPFIPGQYINVEAQMGGIRTTRAYSLSSPSTQRSWYEITVRRTRNGFVSDWILDNVKVGDTLYSSGPTGNFVRLLPVHGKRLIFVAGGSGITPFMSMIETDAEKLDTGKSIDLIYGCAKEDDIIFYDRLKKLEDRGFVRLHPIISDQSADCTFRKGFITAEAIKDIASDIFECTFFLCGPAAMYDFVLPELEKLGVSDRRIRRELQAAPVDPTKIAGWPEKINANDSFTIKTTDGRSFSAKASETVLVAMERNGIVVPTKCRCGECSACRTKLVSGKVFHPGNELLRKSDMKYGYMHPCVTYPISNIELLIK
jgi:glycine betaine catabolism B